MPLKIEGIKKTWDRFQRRIVLNSFGNPAIKRFLSSVTGIYEMQDKAKQDNLYLHP